MTLTVLECTNATCPAGRPRRRLSDGGGLYLFITPAGTKSWRVNYERGGKRTVMVLGHFPAMGPAAARKARMMIRDSVEDGGDPRAELHAKRAARATASASTVRVIGEAWLKAGLSARHWSARYHKGVGQRLAQYIWKPLGGVPVASVDRMAIQELLNDIAANYPAQAVHIRQHLSGIFDHALALGLIQFNPVYLMRTILPSRVRGDSTPRASVKTIERAREILRLVETSDRAWFVLLAHRLIALTSVRKTEATEAEWSEVDLANGVWTIPKERMKGRRGKKRDHIVVLAPQAVEVFRAARAASPDTALVFPGVVHHTQPIAESTLDEMLGKVLRAAKQDGAHTIHGWRSCFSTIMNERHELQHRETVDLMLAHKAFEATEGLYNRATVLARRRALATEWAEALLVGAPDAFTLIGLGDLRPATVTPPTAPSNVVKLPRKAA